MSTFEFKPWCQANELKEATIHLMKKEDLDSDEALKLLTSNATELLGLSMGQKQVFEAALRKLKQTRVKDTTSNKSIPVTTKSLAKDGSLEEILNKAEGVSSLEDSLLALGMTNLSGSGKSPATLNSSTLSRLDNDPHMFLGHRQKAGTKQGEKPSLIPDFVNLGTFDNSEKEQEIGSNASGAKTVLHAAKGKPELEQITLSMWVAANLQILHKLLKQGRCR